MSSSRQPLQNVLSSSTPRSRQQPAECCGSEVRQSKVRGSPMSLRFCPQLGGRTSTLGGRVGAGRAKESCSAWRAPGSQRGPRPPAKGLAPANTWLPHMTLHPPFKGQSPRADLALCTQPAGAARGSRACLPTLGRAPSPPLSAVPSTLCPFQRFKGMTQGEKASSSCPWGALSRGRSSWVPRILVTQRTDTDVGSHTSIAGSKTATT